MTDGSAFDLDASAFVLDENGKVLSDSHFVFYNNLKDPSGAVMHAGDNLTGEGEGDDEQITVELDTMPANAAKVAFVVTIHEAEARKQNFGQVSNAFIRAVNADGNTEIARYDLSEDASIETAMIFGELYRHGNDWKFKAIGQGYAGGLAAVAKDFGVSV
jgi:tellurium resistance protein TerD